MSDFSTNFSACLTSKGIPTPGQVFESVGEAIEFLGHLRDAAEFAGIEITVMSVSEAIQALLAAGQIAPSVAEPVLQALGAAATITIAAYIGVCIDCAAAANFTDFKRVASNDPAPWLTQAIAEQGIDVQSGSAVA